MAESSLSPASVETPAAPMNYTDLHIAPARKGFSASGQLLSPWVLKRKVYPLLLFRTHVESKVAQCSHRTVT